MGTQRSPRLAASVAILEGLLMFIVGIMGNEIAEALQMSPVVVGIITVSFLLILSAISYTKNQDISAHIVKPIPSSATVGRFIPKTVVSIFPIGLTMGFIVGMLTIPIVGSSISDIGILSFDFFGVLCGLVSCLLFAIIFDGPLAGGLAFGYGLSYSTSALLLQPFVSVYYSPLYYLAYIVGFIVYAIILAVAEPKFAMIRRTITEPRL